MPLQGLCKRRKHLRNLSGDAREKLAVWAGSIGSLSVTTHVGTVGCLSRGGGRQRRGSKFPQRHRSWLVQRRGSSGTALRPSRTDHSALRPLSSYARPCP
jgi:hypothetical protein